MNPKKASTLCKQVSEELNCKEELVEDFVNFYYKNLRENLSNLTHPYIRVPGLGFFVLKTKMTQSAIDYYEERIKNFKAKSFATHGYKKMMEERLEMLNKVNVIVKKENERKQKIRNLQHELRTKKNLEKPETDI
jgi:nucleoid DNA-binding protein